MKGCVQCNSPILEESLSFEQLLIGDKEFCRKCWDYVMSEEDIPVTYRTQVVPYIVSKRA